jgi:hypothetical protein
MSFRDRAPGPPLPPFQIAAAQDAPNVSRVLFGHGCHPGSMSRRSSPGPAEIAGGVIVRIRTSA